MNISKKKNECHVTDVIVIFHFGLFFAISPPNFPKKMKIGKNTTADIITLNKCTKNHDHMLYCSWEIARDWCNCYFWFWGTFCPPRLPATPTPNSPKSQNFVKMKKNNWKYYHFTHVYQKLWLNDVRFLGNGARRTDTSREKVTNSGGNST